MTKKDELITYVADCIELGKIEHQIAELENLSESYDRLIEADESIADKYAPIINDVNEKLLRLKIKRNIIDNKTLEFQVKAYTEEE